MIVKIPKLLSQEEVRYCRNVLEASEWIDGKASAGEQARDVKDNLQLEIGSEPFVELGERVLRALGRNPLFNSLTIPLRVRSPMFNRYDVGMHYGPHVDGAIHSVPGAPRMRADLSSTLFLSDPDEYDGGELVMHRLHSTEVYKLNAGDLLVYPTDVIHSVSPVTRGTRWAAFFWTQSLVKSQEQRTILHELDMAIVEIRKLLPDAHPAVLALTSSYHNQLRLASEL
ncbi:Fe2+-dependent dioxygenase [Paraburkholderia sp. Ac-20347]|jgi:PKHD-type hydroxylase|uniref:Fe2+-dependent dioxygenase n=1 Tax=Paraburkholderia sp. Ac-20347 TaxID=2703892 RepID=UPI00197DB845|nr:Fe2+-dependent dioxygenase [Paraburkholderia sp. Ac-20347]MBN3808339.1 Fe2+-dependent dioxygenase [Paraburkholderia sp. Ac-20347]